MKVSCSIVILCIAFANQLSTFALPTNLANGLNKGKLTLKNQLPSGKMNPEHMGGHYQGDMIFPQNSLRGAASRPAWQRWPSGVIPYNILPSITTNHRTMITTAMRDMEKLTEVDGVPCIQFRPRTADDDIFITIQNGTGCSAHVGYLQPYTLNRTVTLMYAPPYTCMVPGIIQHELLHILGFFHEQSRPDRDDYVTVQWANIVPGAENNFAKYGDEDIDTLGTSYDYGSVMHYETDAFTINGLQTLVPTQSTSETIGQRVAMSAIDVLEVQRYYGCVKTPDK